MSVESGCWPVRQLGKSRGRLASRMRRQRQQETMSKEKSATDEPEDDVDDNPTRFSDKERSKVKIFQVVHLIFY